MKFEPQKHEREKMTQKKNNPMAQILQDDKQNRKITNVFAQHQ
jgi:hypothetical protein